MEAPLVAFDDAGLLVRRGRGRRARLERIAWRDLTHVTALPRGLWVGWKRGLFTLQFSQLAPDEAAHFDPMRLASEIRRRWLTKVPGALDRMREIERVARRPPALRAVVAMLALTVVGYGFQWVDFLFLGFGSYDRELVELGEWWRLVTANLLHAMFPFHVLTTLFALPVLGLLVERPLGSTRTAVVMGAAGLAAMLASHAAGLERVVGGSGVVAGLAGAVLALELVIPDRLPASWRVPRRLFIGALVAQVALEVVLAVAGPWLARNYGWFLPQIASAAHAGGFACGFALAAVFAKPAIAGRPAGLFVRGGAAAIVLLVVASCAQLAPALLREPSWLSRHAERSLRAETTVALWANNIAWVMAVEEDQRGAALVTALGLAERAVAESERMEPSFLDTLAEIHFLSGDPDSAIEVIDEARALAPGVPYLEAQRARFTGERAADDRPEAPADDVWLEAIAEGQRVSELPDASR